MRIKSITARKVFDSRGNFTIEVTVSTRKYEGKSMVPAGAIVEKAIKNISKIEKALKGKDPSKQREIDEVMVHLDGTKDKSKLGANTILGVSLACAQAAKGKRELYQYLNKLTKRKMSLPLPYLNVINGGKHADNGFAFQECMIVPQYSSFEKNITVAAEVYHKLKKIIHKEYGSSLVGDEGGFAPKVRSIEEALDLLVKASKGYKIKIAIDAAASEFYKRGKYHVGKKKLNSKQLLQLYLTLIKKYPIISIEDPFQQNDFKMFKELQEKSQIQIVGDDLTVTNLDRIEKAIDSCNCLLLKVNQIGTLTEALDAAQYAFDHKWNVMVSHRSGETEDTFIADLSVALGCGQIKSGAPCRGERTAKYNRLLEISSNSI